MKTVLFFFLWCISFTISAQYWTDISDRSLPDNLGKRMILPNKYRALTFDTLKLRAILADASLEKDVSAPKSNTILSIPMPDGTTQNFRIVEYSMMEAALADRYPDIKTFKGIGIEDPTHRIRLDWNLKGFHAMIVTPEGSTFIDPLYRNNLTYYQSYFKKDFTKEGRWECYVEDEKINLIEDNNRNFSGDCVFRSYRLAVATTGEYSNYFEVFDVSGEGIILSEVETAINRVNDVYEADVSIRLILIASTINVFYYDGATDPYSNTNGSAMLGENQTTMTTEIGSANYDIGHVFSTGGGGVATLNSPCSINSKARGVTGQSEPEGDPFSIDYVAHEMGHQFGANHTQNNNCNRAGNTSMEPGSASTIMGYAGICSPDVQSNSDAYFHGVSIQEINDFISLGNGNSCDTPLPFGNNAPVVTAQGDYTIPISTPFVLTAVATDTDNDPITYCWEQYDNEVGDIMPPDETNVDGPMFRSLFATTSPSRYFPNIDSIAAGINPVWEELPSVSRDMEFRVTVRDFHNVAGCTDEDNVLVSANNIGGPFLVTSQNTATTWLETENVTITWDVANTTASPINCANVDIFLSYDGGLSYPAQLADDMPNNGSAIVEVPIGTSNTARIMVKAADNIFFNINDTDITINPGTPNFTLDIANSTIEICSENSIAFDIEVGSFQGFSNPVTLDVLNLPIGVTYTISTNPVVPGNSSTILLNNLSTLDSGLYSFQAEGASTTGNKTLNVAVEKIALPESVSLIEPLNDDQSVDILPKFLWTESIIEQSSRIQLSEDSLFSSYIINDLIDTNVYQLVEPLNIFTNYYWRVRGINQCGVSAWSNTFNFNTKGCITFLSSDTPLGISNSGTPSITSTINNPSGIEISDINIGVQITHTWIADIDIKLIGPGNQEIILVQDICGQNNDMNLIFDDEASSGNIPCPPTDGLAYQPEGSLSTLYNLPGNGNWSLQVDDDSNQDGGSLDSWQIEICFSEACQLMVDQSSGSLSGSLEAAINCALPGDTIRFDAGLNGDTIQLSSPITINKDVKIINTNSNPITIESAINSRAFNIGALGNVLFENVIITGKDGTEGSAFMSDGNITLRNCEVLKVGGGANNTTILNTGNLFLEGDSEVKD